MSGSSQRSEKLQSPRRAKDLQIPGRGEEKHSAFVAKGPFFSPAKGEYWLQRKEKGSDAEKRCVRGSGLTRGPPATCKGHRGKWRKLRAGKHQILHTLQQHLNLKKCMSRAYSCKWKLEALRLQGNEENGAPTPGEPEPAWEGPARMNCHHCWQPGGEACRGRIWAGRRRSRGMSVAWGTRERGRGTAEKQGRLRGERLQGGGWHAGRSLRSGVRPWDSPLFTTHTSINTGICMPFRLGSGFKSSITALVYAVNYKKKRPRI